MAACTDMSAMANNASPPNRYREMPSQPVSSAAIAIPWCSSAVRRRSEKISDSPNMMSAQAVAGAMRAAGCMIHGSRYGRQ